MAQYLKLMSVMSVMSCLMRTARGQGVENVLDPEASSLHYNFDHSYGYDDHHLPYVGYSHKHGHHFSDIGRLSWSYGNHGWSHDRSHGKSQSHMVCNMKGHMVE